MDAPPATASAPTLAQGRGCVALAALLWGLSGAFTKLLTRDTALHLDVPPVAPLLIAFYRATAVPTLLP